MGVLFFSFTILVVVLVGATVVRLAPIEVRVKACVGLRAWASYAAAVGYFGPRFLPAGASPLPMLLAIPAVILVMFCARSQFGGELAQAIPAYALMGLESVRIGIEVFLHQLWLAGLVPAILTYDGANFDLLIGLSAPVVAWLLLTGRLAPRGAIAWSVIGIAMLVNVVVLSILTTPGPTHFITSDVANQAVTLFPYTFIPGLLAPLAVLLHVLAIRNLRSNQPSHVSYRQAPPSLVAAKE